MARKTDIRLRRSNTANAVPTSGNLSLGEMAMNTADGALYFKTSDNTVITAHDNTIMHIDSLNDRVGIGTSSPARQLTVQNSSNAIMSLIGSTSGLAYYTLGDTDDDNYAQILLDNSTNTLQIQNGGGTGIANRGITLDSSENVGIGTSSPSFKLDVVGDGRFSGQNNLLYLDSGTTGSPLMQFRQGTTRRSFIRFENSRTAFDLINEYGGISFWTGVSGSEIERIQIDTTGHLTFVGDNRHIYFGGSNTFIGENSNSNKLELRGGGSSSGQTVYIDNTGQMGLGTSAPSSKLHVKGDISNSSVADYGLAAFENTNLEGLNIGYDADGNHSYLYSREVGVSSRGLRLNGAIYIDSYDGNVGVGTGTNTLSNKLQVDGFAAIYDGLRLGSAGSGEGIFRYNPGTGNNGIGITTGSLNQGGIRLFVQHPTDGGGVGIGTTTPSQKLEVDGAILIKDSNTVGTLYLTNTSVGIKRSNAVDTTNSRDIEVFTDGGGANIVFSTNGAGSADVVIKENGRLDAPSMRTATIEGDGTNSALTITQANTDIDTQSDDINIITAGGGRNATAGSINITTINTSNESSGSINLTTGNTSGNVNSGDITLTAGSSTYTGGATIEAGSVYLIAGDTSSATNNTKQAGHVYIEAGTNTVDAPRSGDIIFTTNNSERARVDSGGGVLIGNATNFSDAGADDLQVGNTSGAHGISIMSQNSHNGNLFFGDNDNNDAGRISYNHTNNRMEFYTNRSQRMVITSAGNVGIGTNAAAEKLEVRDGDITTRDSTNTNYAQLNRYTGLTLKGNGTGSRGVQTPNTDALTLGTNNTERVRITADGDIGIGITSPQAKLDIAGATATDSPIIRLTGTGEASQDDTIGEIQFYNSDTTDLTPGVMSSIRATAGASGGEGQLRIYTNMPSEGVAAATLAATFAADGNTIFGGTSVGAASAMSVKVDGTYTDLYLYGAGTSQGGRIFFGDSSDRSSITGTYGTGGGGKLSFKTDTTGGTSQDRLVIDSDGSIRFNNAFTFPTSIGSSGQVLKVPSTGSTLVWADDAGGGSATVLTDTDGDTKIQVEESADEDIIRFDIAGTEQMQLNSTGLTVAGNLTVNGTQTILNTATLTVDDLNITVADGAADAAAANGAGLTVDGANATWTYSSGDDAWASNKHAQFYTGGGSGSLSVGRSSDQALRLYADDNYNRIFAYQDADSNTDHFFDLVRSFAGTGRADFRIMNGSTVHMLVDKNGNVGINNTNPAYKLDVGGNTRVAGSLNVVGLLQSYSGTFNIKNIAQDQDLNLNVNDGGTDTTAITIKGTTANVGINQSAPTKRLHIKNSANNDDQILLVEAAGSTTYGVYLKSAFSAQMGRIGALSQSDGGLDGASIAFEDFGRDIAFRTNEGSNNSEKARILESGEFGIGTTTPDSKLTVNTTTTGDGIELQSTEVSIAKLSRHVVDSTVVASLDGVTGRPIHVGGVVNEDVILANGGGNVGIGFTNPSAKLQVDGAIVSEGGSFASAQEGSATDVGLVIQKNDWIYSDDDTYLRKIIGHSSTNHIVIGQQNTALIGDIIMYPGSSGNIRFYGSGSEDVRIDTNGRLGIGTTNPGVKLTVNNSAFPQLRLEDADDLMDVGFSGNSFYLKRGDNDGHIIFRRADNADVLVADMSNKRVAIGTSTPKATLQVEEYGIDTSSTTTTVTTQVAIHTFPIADFRTARFTIQITNTTDSTYHSTEIIAVHDGTTANITEFGEVHTGTSVEATFDADISSNNFRLLATPASTDSMTFKVVCHSITV